MPPTQMARLTGSRRRISSDACDSASRLMCIGIESKSGQRCAHSDRELRRYMVNFSSLLRRQCDLQKIERIPRPALDHQFGLQGLNDKFSTGRAAADIHLGDGLVLLMLKKVD